MLNPKTFVMRVGEALLLGGVARLEYLGGATTADTIFCTVFCSKEMPIHVLRSSDLDRFLDKFWGSKVLRVPSGSVKRLELFPKLQSANIELIGSGTQDSCADVILSSAGWIAVTACKGVQMNFKAYTPGGVGIYVRRPALLPYAVRRRGGRIVGTSAYKVQSLRENDEHAQSLVSE